MSRLKALAVRSGRTNVLAAGLLLTAICGVALVVTNHSAAELTGPKAGERQIALSVATLLERIHLARRPLDDEMSSRCLEQFLETLDPLKMHFLKEDVQEIERMHTQIDDEIRRGETDFAYKVFEIFLKRVEDRTRIVEELLDSELDFTRDERLYTDPDQLDYPADLEEARQRWRKRVKYDMLVQKAEEKSLEEARQRLHRRYQSFARRMRQTDNDELLEMYLTALTSSFDPHTSYMSKSTLENFKINMRLELDGIGASLQSEDGYTVVHKVIPGGAADKDQRLKPKDRIVAVGQGKDGEMVDVIDMKLNDVVQLIRGKRGTVVRLGVISAGETVQKIYDITRARIELKDSEARSEISTEGTKTDGSPLKLGVIELPSFYMDMEGARLGKPDYKSTTRDVRKILENFKSESVDAVVVDLRRNGGGSLTEAVNLTGLFIEEGPVVQVKGFDGAVEPYDDRDSAMVWRGPLIVLISQFSASASEIFAGAIQDYQRGLIVGDAHTHGKGTVQQLLDLGEQIFRIPNAPKLGALKITIQQFYRPSGDSTQARGVLADVELPSLTTHLDAGEADLDHALKFDRVQAAEFESYKMLNPNMVATLKKRSSQRRSQSEDFQKVKKKIQEYLKRKERKWISVNEQEYMAEKKKLDAEKEEEEELEQLNDPNRPVIEKDFYYNEIVEISRDYVNMLDADKVANK